MQLRDFPTILQALNDPIESIASDAATIVSHVGAEVLATEEYENILCSVADSSDERYARISNGGVYTDKKIPALLESILVYLKQQVAIGKCSKLCNKTAGFSACMIA